MTTIKLTATDQTLTAYEKVKIASGDIESVMLQVEFDSAWDDYSARTACFYTSKDKTVIEVLMVDNECTVPYEVLAEAGVLCIGVRGATMDGASVKTSSIVQYKIVQGAPSGDTTLNPTMDLYQQYLKAMYDGIDPLSAEIKSDILTDVDSRLAEHKEETKNYVKDELFGEFAAIDLIERSSLCTELEEVSSTAFSTENDGSTYKNEPNINLDEVIFEGAVTVEDVGGYPRSIIISAPMTLLENSAGLSNYTDSSHFFDNSYLKIEVNYLGKTYELYPSRSSYTYDDVIINLSPIEETEILKGRVDISVKCSLHIEATESGITLEEFAVRKGSWSVSVPKTKFLVAAE